MSYKESVGIIGGFGAYATLDFYRRFLEKFNCECERDYPHIYIWIMILQCQVERGHCFMEKVIVRLLKKYVVR